MTSNGIESAVALPMPPQAFRGGFAGLPRRTLCWTTAAAVAVGAVYALSPLTVLFALAMVGLFRWAGRGQSVEERRWLFRTLGAAVALRVLAVLVLFLFTDPARQQFNAFFADGPSTIARSLWIRNLWLGVPIGPFYTVAIYDPYGASDYFYWLAFLQTIFGPAPYGLNFVSICVFLAGTVALYRLVRSAYGPEPAFFSFLLLLFWPTLFAWSISVLKDPLHFCLAAVTIAATVSAIRAAGWSRRLLALAIVIGGLAGLGALRSGGIAIAALGISMGLVARVVTLRRSIGVVVVTGLIVGSLGLILRPGVQGRIRDEIQMAANRHLGHVRTPGISYRVLDQRIYSEGPEATFRMTTAERARFTVRSIAAFVLVPLPWQSVTRATFLLVPQQIVWYVLVLLAIAGCFYGVRRDALLTFLLAGYAIAGAGVISLNSGNIGTLIRYRDMVVPFVIGLSGLGAWSIVARLTQGMTAEPPRLIRQRRRETFTWP